MSAFGLGGCASWFGDSESAGESGGSASAEQVPGEKQTYPNLATVPDRPVPETTAAERREIAQGLVADRARAQYTDQELRAREPASIAPPPAPPPTPPAAASQPAPTSALPSPPADSDKPMPDSAAPAGNATMSTTAMTSAQPAAADAAASPPPAPPPPPASAYSSAQPIPQIVRRTDAPAPPMYAGQQPQPMSGDGKQMPPYPPLGPSAAPAPVRDGPMSNPSSAATARPAPMPAVGLPVTQEQATLEQTFARNLAQQSSGTVGSAAAPPGAMAAAGSTGAPALRELPGMVNGAPAVTVRFGHGVTRLDGDAKQQLSDFAAQARAHSGIVRVVGHSSHRTGNTGGAKPLTANFNVSVDRANAVARELVELGVEPARLKVEAVGASMPRFNEDIPSGEAENRRVEVYLE